jgi:predicted enzyme related to lactoylglutathione lyase
MIRGIHGLFFSSEPDALRAFLRDKLQLPHTDVGGGWLIFDLPEADLGVHPLDESGKPPSGTHQLSFYCDDIQATVAGMKARGVEFKGEVADQGWGFVTSFTMPGGVHVQLYEPKFRKEAPSKKKASKPSKTAKSAKKSKPSKPVRRPKKASPARKRR